MDKNQLAKRIKESCLLKGDFTLSSGIKTDHYWEKYNFLNQPELLWQVVREIYEITYMSKPAGLELGGALLASSLANYVYTTYQRQLNPLFVRKQPTDHGSLKSKWIKGVFKKGEHVWVIEDVITIGRQVIYTINCLENEGLLVDGVACVIDRQEGGDKNIGKNTKHSISFYSVFTQEFLFTI